MRQLRHGAPFGWLLSLLFPLLVAAGPGAFPSPASLTGTAAAPRHFAIIAERRPLSQESSAGERPHLPGTLTSALLSILAGPAGSGGHPAVVPQADFTPALLPTGPRPRATGEAPFPSPAPGTGPARAPPATSTGA
ncbi:hypothetical protein [Streptosporangium sp. NPDC020145]|uniref:hypothetical protein n=1 Tax=Streptosporangium sp. NPDC020145 TaxID=3154694 RepID=UPI0034301B1F